MGGLQDIIFCKKGGTIMREKLTPYERRNEILTALVHNKKITISQTAINYNVSEKTISRDIDFLSKEVPIYTKAGCGGGVFIHKDYHLYNNYLSSEEERFLLDILKLLPSIKRKKLEKIIFKFSSPKI